MKIYISGQISKMDYSEAFDLFQDAEIYLRNWGYEPVNPMKSEGEVPGKKWAEYIAEDVIILDECDGIYMLPNWRNSDGARIEHHFCEVRNKQIFYAASEIEVHAANDDGEVG